MAGHKRPLFVLFGASLTDYSCFQPGGWGASLADYYARKADILLRGFCGWNTRRAVAVLEEFFPKDHPSQPALVIVFFGSNDAACPLRSGKGQHVPLQEYKGNLRQICAHIKGLSDTSRVVLITPPPVFEEARRAHARRKWGINAGKYLDRTNERTHEYAEACLDVAKEMDVGVVDLWNAFRRTKGWETDCLSDGLHLSPIGNQILLEELLKRSKGLTLTPSQLKGCPKQPFTTRSRKTINNRMIPQHSTHIEWVDNSPTALGGGVVLGKSEYLHKIFLHLRTAFLGTLSAGSPLQGNVVEPSLRDDQQ